MMLAVRIDAVRKRVKARQVFTWQDLLVLLECRVERRKVAYLTTEIGVPKPSVSRVISSMEDLPQPLLKRIEDPDDRRSPWVEITAAGKRFLEGLLLELPDAA
jgi:DNA-binding MarR family transcriptional regulator